MKVRIHPAFTVYLAFIAMINGLQYVLCLLITLLIHEAGHLLIGRIFNEEYALLEVTPLGGMLAYKPGHPSCKGLKGACIAAAGPACSISAIYLFCISPLQTRLAQDISQAFLCMNVFMFLFNLIPALPLDGGRIVFCLGYYVFPIAQLGSLLTALGRITGASGVVLSIYGCIRFSKLNISLLAAGMYIMLYAVKQKEILYASTLHTVIQERLSSPTIQAVQVIRVSKNVPITEVIPFLCRTKNCIFVIEHDNQMQFLSEKTVLQRLLADPAFTFAEAFLEQ